MTNSFFAEWLSLQKDAQSTAWSWAGIWRRQRLRHHVWAAGSYLQTRPGLPAGVSGTKGADSCLGLGRYLVPEFEDTAFGPRASAVHTRLQEELLSSRDSTFVLNAIPKQMEVIAMLRHINSELKVRRPPWPGREIGSYYRAPCQKH